ERCCLDRNACVPRHRPALALEAPAREERTGHRQAAEGHVSSERSAGVALFRHPGEPALAGYYEVVPVDDLVAAVVTEQALDLAGVPPPQAFGVGARVRRQAACDLLAARRTHDQSVAAFESSHDL